MGSSSLAPEYHFLLACVRVHHEGKNAGASFNRPVPVSLPSAMAVAMCHTIVRVWSTWAPHPARCKALPASNTGGIKQCFTAECTHVT